MIKSFFDPDLLEGAERLLSLYRARKLTIATAESCTGGLIAGLLTEIAGSSDVVYGGFITYSNKAKRDFLGVPETLLAAHGAVSAPVAQAMAAGALDRSAADVAIAVTGIAGPGGGSAQKPVGLVYLGLASRRAPVRTEERRFGDRGRSAVRRATLLAALALLAQAATDED